MYIDNKDPQFQKLIKMPEEEFDKYMCETYPIMFKERGKSIEESCMAWGFNIGKGWYYILDNACRKLQEIAGKTGIQTIFTQIKEKFGTARFYYDTTTVCEDGPILTLPKEQQEIWYDIIRGIVSDAESATVHTCAECGGHHYENKPSSGFWVHDTCHKCFLKAKPEFKEEFEKREKHNDLVEELQYLIHKLTPEEYAIIEKTIADAKDRLENNSNKNE